MWERRWLEITEIVREHRDVLDERPSSGEPTPSLVSRDWADPLLAMSDAALDEIETRGLDASWPAELPASLRALVERIREACIVARFSVEPGEARPRRRQTPRKAAQVDAFVALVRPLLARARRVIDVGSGHGHLTREIADRIDAPVVGLERNQRLVGMAESLRGARGPSFAVTDVLADGVAAEPGDCLVALHACGELGDLVVKTAAARGASVALVGCCLQKQRAAVRSPLASAGRSIPELELPKSVLGLSNLTARDEGVEASRAENLAGRQRRLALHRLLSELEPGLRFGSEMEGLNRRAAHAELGTLVRQAFGVRGLACPSTEAVERAAAWAATHHPRARRLALPRTMLGRALEVFVVLDRARYLEERGFRVDLGALFPSEVSPRNLYLSATSRS